MIALELLLAGGGAALAIGGYVAYRAWERKRRAAHEEFSAIRGFRFEAERPGGEAHLRDVFEPFNQGRQRRWGYTITGTKNRAPFTAFEYRWVTGSGRHSSAHRIAGIVWERDAPFPAFVLTPQGWLMRVGIFFGMQDIDFDESPEFSRAYRLKGPDEASVRSLFSSDVRHFFAATPDQQVAGGGRYLLWWRSGRFPPIEKLDEWLERGDHVRRRFIKE